MNLSVQKLCVEIADLLHQAEYREEAAAFQRMGKNPDEQSVVRTALHLLEKTGSFNDLVIMKEGEALVEENNRLFNLRKQLYHLAHSTLPTVSNNQSEDWLQEIDSFRSPDEFSRFKSYLADRLSEGEIIEIDPESPSFYHNSPEPERWFKDTSTKKKWRLVAPDFPFKGNFKKVDSSSKEIE